MKHLKILNTREAKQFKNALKEQFGFEGDLDYAFLRSNKDKIYIVNPSIAEIKYENLRIDSIGMYFAEKRPTEYRLSIDGSQLIGPKATKRVVELNDEQFKAWFNGEDVEVEDKEKGFHIVKHGNDFIGCGHVSENELKNYVPKTRRIKNLNG